MLVSPSNGAAAALQPVDGAEVTLVVDNFVDLLMAGAKASARYSTHVFGDPEQLIAEHGFAALVTIDRRGERRSLLYDAGMTPAALGGTWTCSEWRSRTCARSSFPTATPITTAAWKAYSDGMAAAACRS